MFLKGDPCAFRLTAIINIFPGISGHIYGSRIAGRLSHDKPSYIVDHVLKSPHCSFWWIWMPHHTTGQRYASAKKATHGLIKKSTAQRMHWNGNVVILTTFLSLAAPVVFQMTGSIPKLKSVRIRLMYNKWDVWPSLARVGEGRAGRDTVGTS